MLRAFHFSALKSRSELKSFGGRYWKHGVCQAGLDLFVRAEIPYQRLVLPILWACCKCNSEWCLRSNHLKFLPTWYFNTSWLPFTCEDSECLQFTLLGRNLLTSFLFTQFIDLKSCQQLKLINLKCTQFLVFLEKYLMISDSVNPRREIDSMFRKKILFGKGSCNYSPFD